MTTILVLIARRVAGNWRLMGALALGFVVAVGLMASTVLYADALDDLGLDFALRRADQRELDVLVTTGSRLNPGELGNTLRTIEEGYDTWIARYARERVRVLRSGTFYPTAPGTPVDAQSQDRPRAYFQSWSGIGERVRVEGRRPSADPQPAAIEAAVGAPAAERLGVTIGDEFDLYPFWDESREPVRVTVVGIYHQLDPSDDYWAPLLEPFDHRSTSWPTYAFFVEERALVEGLGGAHNDIPGDVAILGIIDRSRLGPGESAAVQGSIGAYNSFLQERVRLVSVKSGLPQLLSEFDARLKFSRIPLFVVIIQIVGIAMYYLVMVASMLVERQSGEIALLKSRGGTTRQVMLIYLVEGAALCLLALALAPPLASLVVSMLGKTGIFSDLTGGARLEAPLTLRVYGIAAGGALLALAALLIPAWLATRNTIVHFKQSLGRADRQPIFFRYYLDLFFVALVGMLFFQLRHKGSLASENLFGDLETDPLLLLSPAVFLVTAGVMFLRLFPLLLRVVSAALRRTALTAPLVAMWHLVRNPTHYGRLVLLLILATSIGMFSAAFGNTLNSNYGDRARYEAGADARLVALRPPSFPASAYYAALEGAPGVAASAAVLRHTASYQMDQFRSVSPQIIGIDERFKDVAFYRGDFSPASLDEITRELRAGAFEPPPGPSIPEGDAWLSVFIYTGPANGPLEMSVQLRGANGARRDARMFRAELLGQQRNAAQLAAPPQEEGWHRYIGAIPVELEGPVTVQGFSVRRLQNLGADRGRLLFDQVESAGAAPAADTPISWRAVTSFEEGLAWEPIEGLTRRPLADRAGPVQGEAHDGAVAIEFAWTEPVPSFTQRGFRLRDESGPLRVFASDSFLAASGLSVGDSMALFAQATYVRAEIVGSITYFPTVARPLDTPFLVVGMDQYAYLVNRAPGTIGGVSVDELWLKGASLDFDPRSVLALLPAAPSEVVEASHVLAGREQDPLTAAGWQGILAISFGAVLTLSAVGFVVYSYLSAQGRRLEFAILRTLGLTRKQVAGVVATEQAIVVGLGMLAGSLVGLRLGPTMIGYLGITETGEEVIPPYRDVTDWLTLATTYSTLLAVFLGATLLIIALYSRLAIHRVLRLGEL
jgi:hypothetical protein